MQEENACRIEEPKILEIFYEFLDNYAQISNKSIVQAYQIENPFSTRNIEQIEEDLDFSYILIDFIEKEDRGTNILSMTEDEDIEQSISMHKAIVEIEIFSLLQYEVSRSLQLISSMFTHPRGVEFFKNHDISPLYVEKMANTSKIDKNSKYFSAKIRCHCTYYSKIIEKIDTFSSLNLKSHVV